MLNLGDFSKHELAARAAELARMFSGFADRPEPDRLTFYLEETLVLPFEVFKEAVRAAARNHQDNMAPAVGRIRTRGFDLLRARPLPKLLAEGVVLEDELLEAQAVRVKLALHPGRNAKMLESLDSVISGLLERIEDKDVASFVKRRIVESVDAAEDREAGRLYRDGQTKSDG